MTGHGEPAKHHAIRRRQIHGAVTSARHWAGYGWFMSFGTICPLITFLGSYVFHLTFVGAPVARVGYRFGIWTATLGQEPPRLNKKKGEDEGEGEPVAEAEGEDEAEKPPFAERIRPYTPPGVLERRGRPVPTAVRVIWFVLAGWWLGAVWVVLSWSVFLAPYPFLEVVAGLLDELPTAMTLAYPKPRRRGAPD
jgi:hypothetical protein